MSAVRQAAVGCVALSILAWGSAALAQLRIPGFEPPAPYCRQHDPPKEDAWEIIATFALGVQDPRVPRIFWITAGDRVAVRVPSSEVPGLRIGVYVKPFGNWSFERVCHDVPLKTSSGDLLFEAVRPGQSGGSVWRIEFFRSAVRPNHPSPGISLSLWRARARRDDADDEPISEELSDASGLLCIEDARPPPPHRSAGGFAGKVRLDIDLAESDVTLRPAERQAIMRLLLMAGSLWTEACVNCQVEQLAIIAIGGQVFVRRGLVEWYQKEMPSDPSSPNAAVPDELEATLAASLEPTQWLLAGDSQPPAPRSKEFSDYSPLSAKATAAICSLHVAQERAPTFNKLQRVLCVTASTATPERARMLIRFSLGHTACGNSTNIIGCRSDNELTEYNIRDYAFAFDVSDGPLPPVGQGPIPVSLLQVLVHEMGHWIGLPHLNGSQTIMASSLEMSRCIDSLTVSSLERLDQPPRRAADQNTIPLPFRYRTSRAGELR